MRYKVPTQKIVYDEKKLYNYGINRLSVRDYGRQELFDKMSKWQEDISIVNKVLDKLESLGYLSEERRIRNLINLYLPKEGIKKLKLRLYQKKLNKELIENILSDLDKNEEYKAFDLLVKKYKNFVFSDNEEKQKKKEKMLRFLVSKGLSYQDGIKAINEFILTSRKTPA